jgi:8-oxo-dGTP diphosphatase
MSQRQTVLGASVKNRATVICCQEGRILLVARAGSRWSLPGGSIKRTESPSDAARRELEEETSLVDVQVEYLFHFGGLGKRHHVFIANLSGDASPKPRNEIERCEWFSTTKIATLSTSVPTQEIVGLFTRHIRLDKSPPVRLEDHAVSETHGLAAAGPYRAS